MDAAPAVDTPQTTSLHTGDASEVLDRGDASAVQSGISAMKVEDLGHKEGGLQWEQSPERTTSLLPPFGGSQPSHLPTPQSPGNLANYLSGPAGSPLSLEHPRPGPSRYFSTLHPPSRPASAHPPKTPQRGPSASGSKNTSFSAATQDDLKDGSQYQADEKDSARQPLSQIATPSPEVFRARRASVPNTPSDSGTMLTTPQVERRSSSHPYTGPTTLAPAPIISPANSIHSTIYQASPEFEHEELQPASRTYNFSHGMAALVSEHNIQVAARDQEYYGLADPFVVPGGEDLRAIQSRPRYPSPPPSKHHQHCSTHGSTSPLLKAKAGSRGSLENSIAKLVMSPSEFSDAPSHGSPVKVEVEDRDDDITMDPPRSLTIDRTTPSRAPTSPRTPPPARSGRVSTSESHASVLEDPAFRTPPPPSGGEMERIRQRQAILEGSRVAESEKRRPEYLLRLKRARDSADDDAAERERESALSGLGVTVSPVKGRRLKLYQPVAVASDTILEDREIETEEVAEPKTPPPFSTVPGAAVPPWQPMMPTMSLRAIDWRTPGRGRSSPAIWTEEDELKKQRRLHAFAASQPSGKGRTLKPVDVEGQGRVIIDVTLMEVRELAKAGALQLSETAETVPVEDTELSAGNGHGAEWPDKEYPWSVQERQRDEYEEAEKRRRLAWIERFLDRESESEDEDNECVAGPSTWNHTLDVGPLTRPQRGRGKSILLNAAPNSRRSGGGQLMSFGAANADARQVLLSKKHVRKVAERLRKRKVAEEEEGVVMCICQGADDGRAMVRCDECRTWYHLICMDIHDESELADEWYCWKCLPSAEDPPPPPRTEPTFAPAMPESPPRAGVGDQPLYQSALQPSPMPASPVAHRKRDRSPPRRSRLLHPLGDPGDPVRGGPSTPYQPRSTESRLYSTPQFSDEYPMDEHGLFDPMSTPSRGLKFPGIPVPITPRRAHTQWTPAQPLLWTTPSGPPRTPQFSAQDGSSSTRSLAYSLSTLEDSAGPLTSPWPDESPIRRPHKAGSDSMWPYPSQRILDSPLAVRSTIHRPFLPGVEESPTRHFHKGKDTDIGELVSRAGPGKSPHRD